MTFIIAFVMNVGEDGCDIATEVVGIQQFQSALAVRTLPGRSASAVFRTDLIVVIFRPGYILLK